MRIKPAIPRPRARWLLAAGALVVAVAGALGWVAVASPLLAADEIRISGVQRVEREKVEAASGVRPGTPLARIDVRSVRERVRDLPAVKSARVHRAWPSTLRIAVRERVPIAAVPSGEGYALLDRDGVRVTSAPAPEDGLPVVRITHRGEEVATSPGTSRDAKRAALRVLDALPANVGGQVERIAVGDQERITLRLQGGATVTWGEPGHAAQKARTLTTLLRRHDANSYDVSSLEIVTE